MTLVIDERTATTEAIILSHLPWMVRVARGLTGSLDEADVLVNDTVVSVLPRISGADAPKAYLRTALVNTHLNLMRRRTLEADHRFLAQPDVEHHAENSAVRADLIVALSRLSELQRMVLTLRYLEDQTAPDVGKLIGRSAASVRRIASEAVAALRIALPEDYRQ